MNFAIGLVITFGCMLGGYIEFDSTLKRKISDYDRVLRRDPAEFEARMAMPGPEFVAPMVAYLCTDAAKDVNGQIFHAEKSHYHTYSYGEVARSIYKYENNGEFTVDELIKLIPASLMAGISNVAPAEET